MPVAVAADSLTSRGSDIVTDRQRLDHSGPGSHPSPSLRHFADTQIPDPVRATSASGASSLFQLLSREQFE